LVNYDVVFLMSLLFFANHPEVTLLGCRQAGSVGMPQSFGALLETPATQQRSQIFGVPLSLKLVRLLGTKNTETIVPNCFIDIFRLCHSLIFLFFLMLFSGFSSKTC
jgi:hypothetical protein